MFFIEQILFNIGHVHSPQLAQRGSLLGCTQRGRVSWTWEGFRIEAFGGLHWYTGLD